MKFGAWKYRRRIARALALNRRGEVRRDGLRIIEASMRLKVQWRARLIHPWDRDLPTDTTARLLVAQSFADTEAALDRLFSILPEVDSIELTVLDPVSDQKIMTGIVHRSDVEAARCFASVKMRMRESGIDFRFTDSQLCSLDVQVRD